MGVSRAFCSSSLVVVLAFAGCLYAPESVEIESKVLGIEQKSSDAGTPQVAFNITIQITNVGDTRYELQMHDWLFKTDVNLTAFVGGFKRLDQFDGQENPRVIGPGESATFVLYAFQLHSTTGNLTEFSFQGGPFQPV